MVARGCDKHSRLMQHACQTLITFVWPGHVKGMCEALHMDAPRQPRAWLLMAAGDDRQHGGNTGYDDQADAYYSWDSTVSNYGQIQVGDTVALWDKRKLLGVSIVEEIDVTPAEKLLLRCPNPACHRAGIKPRQHRTPKYRCQECFLEFDQPHVEVKKVEEYRSRHDAAWTALDGLLDAQELRATCESPKSQLSMRALDWTAFKGALESAGATRAISRIQARSPDLVFPGQTSVEIAIPSGHTQSMVRVRRGQSQFRDRLLASLGSLCAFTGRAPARVLDAGHLYSYAKLGKHEEHGGLMLRRDIHRLFDDGWLAVRPDNLRIDVARDLADYPQYARLHEQRLQVNLAPRQQEWIEEHWVEHRP